MSSICKRLTSIFSVICFCVQANAPLYAADQMVSAPISLTSDFLINGMIVHPEDPFQFNFLFSPPGNQVDEKRTGEDALKQIRYFLAALAIPENDLWVNLSPYEPDRIIPDGLAKTEMGRDMLAQDYVLKQLTASLMSPESEHGRKFWDRIYQKAYQRFGMTEIPPDAFNKVWIVPNESSVFENGGRVFVLKSSLKVMMDEDYRKGDIRSGLSSDVKEAIRQVILPEIEREVNEGEQFAIVRQIYHALLLATWFKTRLIKSPLGRVYADQGKTSGIDLAGDQDKVDIYRVYLKAFHDGAFDVIREEYDPQTQALTAKTYFAGGLLLKGVRPYIMSGMSEESSVISDRAVMNVDVNLAQLHSGVNLRVVFLVALSLMMRSLVYGQQDLAIVTSYVPGRTLTVPPADTGTMSMLMFWQNRNDDLDHKRTILDSLAEHPESVALDEIALTALNFIEASKERSFSDKRDIYRLAAVSLGERILSMQDESGFVGNDPSKVAFHVNAISVFKRLFKLTGDKRWKTASKKAWKFYKKNIDGKYPLDADGYLAVLLSPLMNSYYGADGAVDLVDQYLRTFSVGNASSTLTDDQKLRTVLVLRIFANRLWTQGNAPKNKIQRYLNKAIEYKSLAERLAQQSGSRMGAFGRNSYNPFTDETWGTSYRMIPVTGTRPAAVSVPAVKTFVPDARIIQQLDSLKGFTMNDWLEVESTVVYQDIVQRSNGDEENVVQTLISVAKDTKQALSIRAWSIRLLSESVHQKTYPGAMEFLKLFFPRPTKVNLGKNGITAPAQKNPFEDEDPWLKMEAAKAANKLKTADQRGWPDDRAMLDAKNGGIDFKLKNFLIETSSEDAGIWGGSDAEDLMRIEGLFPVINSIGVSTHLRQLLGLSDQRDQQKSHSSLVLLDV